MREFTELTTIQMVDDFLNNHELKFIYISRQDCTVCHALKPKIQQLLEQYPFIHLGHVDAEIVEEVAGRFLVFTVPSLLFIKGEKELIRENRFVRIGKLKEQLDNLIHTL
ncbi:thioredoxin family protein [Cytobacillus horneckiae]|uniref:Thioredoxin n=1 Tax=Cytobacillus horneckiae TaxID=549687 RepID=A0A2N0Z8G8_9BACI|nr:thioredoxin family protein [Cytobacillus horneckiae]NRG45515.1 thioredoxin family protein [Bacillus sp. CRN 9]MCM3177438.1 thioredoxin family protein [Cytobacillus horneckiae]MEC1155999.1 thioredoxin family protein [Cytobacillus horneckiae]MED2939725.1 thioredoxin family protein [Cytobacillus horneckiae]PKG25816.1 thioredoxin [Cytobacillus horneckiae]